MRNIDLSYVSRYNDEDSTVIMDIYKKYKNLFFSVAQKFSGVDCATKESIIFEQIWKCLDNYKDTKATGKLTTMICRYIYNALRTYTESLNTNKRSANGGDKCSTFSEFEGGEDRVLEISEDVDYSTIEMTDIIDNMELTDHQRAFCELFIKNKIDNNLTQVAKELGISRSGAYKIKVQLQKKFENL